MIFLSHLQPVVEPGPFWTLVRNCQSLSSNRAAGVKHVAIQFVSEEGPFRKGPFARRVALFSNEIKCFNPVNLWESVAASLISLSYLSERRLHE